MPRTESLRLEYLHTAEHPICRVPARFYSIFDDAGEHAGNINLRLDIGEAIARYAGHVGYEVFPQHRGHGYAARALRLLLPVAREHGLHTLWITCDPGNLASRRTLERAGAEYVDALDVLYNGTIRLTGSPRKFRYRLATDEEAEG